LLAFRTTPYPAEVRRRILAVSNAVTHTAEISRLNFLLGELYAGAVQELGVKPHLVGCHGQTIYHEGANTLQIGEAAVIAERLGVPVVSDFRTRDIAAGGRGAPLVPYVDYLLFRHARLCRVALNLGGIANITVLTPGTTPDEVVAFDTGPANMVIDQLAEIATGGRHKYDRGGRLAARGRLNRELLDTLLRDAYYRRKPPKTAGREQYGKEFVKRLMETGLPVEDLISTATTLTAATVALGIKRYAPAKLDELIVSGGGTHNPQIMGRLAAFLPGTRVMTSAEMGVNVDAKEAIAFAMLAYQTWHNRPGNLPSATGALRPVVLGKITP
jgi:anhydro-N-acetylmuramic acid kinase